MAISPTRALCSYQSAARPPSTALRNTADAPQLVRLSLEFSNFCGITLFIMNKQILSADDQIPRRTNLTDSCNSRATALDEKVIRAELLVK